MKTRALLSFAVVAILAIAPRPVVAGGRPLADLPGVSVLLGIAAGTDEPDAPPAPTQAVAAAPATETVVEVPAAALPAPKLVRRIDILYVHEGDTTVEPLDVGGPCAKASTCETHELSNVRRPTDDTGRIVIPFAYNDEGRRKLRAPEATEVRAALSRSMAEWSRWNSNIAFEDRGTTTATFAATGADGGCSDDVNVVTWGQFAPGVVGIASTCLDETNRIVRDTDLALNAHHRWVIGTDERRPSYDVESILTHELGHWLSLKDLYVDIDAARQTMFGSADPNETHKRTLALGDVVGVQAAYPCSDGDVCPRDGVVDD